MSQNIQPSSGRPGVTDLQTGLDAFRTSPTFRGPVEPLDGHKCNDHFAQIYETDEERFATAGPFVRHGLDRGERVLYILDDSSEAEVRAALRDADVDVDAALSSGALSFHTVQETYLRNGTFDPDEMIEFYADTVASATEEYEALRIVAETTWLQDDATTVEQFMEYESKVNDLFSDEDCLAICQYDRDGFPPEVVRDIVQTHPHLIYDGTVTHNFYYTPPAEFFGPEEPAREVDRMLGTLVERTEVKAELHQRERFLQKCYEITSDSTRSFEEKVERLLELGCERFGLDMAGLHHLPEWDGEFRLETGVGLGVDSDDETLWTNPGEGCFCQQTIESDEPVGVADVRGTDWENDRIYEEFGVSSYLGTTVASAAAPYGTLWVGSTEPRDRPFSNAERTFIDLMGQWVGYEIERAEHEDRLEAVNTLDRELLDTGTAAEVAEHVAAAAEDTLDLPIAAVGLYDDDAGELRPAARTDTPEELLEATSLLDEAGGVGWEAFVTGEAKRVTDVAGDAHPSVSEVAVHPLGSHGVLLVGSSATDGFGDDGLEFVETVAASARVALARADREQQLQEREDTLEAQNQTLERLNRINDTIRSIDQALVEASTRDEIEAVVCEKLAEQGPYELAWVGEHDSVTDEITSRESAGAEKGYLDAITVTAGDEPEGQGPAGRAVRTGEPQVVNSVLDDESFKPWRQEALNRGYHASVTLPLTYDGTRYGLLNVYADRPGVFDDLERSVLTELSGTIAYAINAVESKKALVSNEVTELEFEVPAADFPMAAVTADLGCEITLENVVPQPDGGLRLFLSVRGASAEAFRGAVPRLPVEDLTLVSEHEADGEPVCLFSARPTDGNLCGTVLDHGGVPRDVSAADGTATVRVDFAADRDVRELVSMFASNYPGAELVAQRSRERPRRTPTEFRAALADELTDRQLQVLQTAYVGGYFETPRTRTGSEIASSLDISQPTFNTHVRTAHRKLCRLLFEHDAALDATGGRA